MKGLEEEMRRILSKGEWISLFDISDMTGATVLTLRRMISRFNVEKKTIRKFNVRGRFYRMRKAQSLKTPRRLPLVREKG